MVNGARWNPKVQVGARFRNPRGRVYIVIELLPKGYRDVLIRDLDGNFDEACSALMTTTNGWVRLDH